MPWKTHPARWKQTSINGAETTIGSSPALSPMSRTVPAGARHSLGLLAAPLPSWTTWRTWRLKPAILAHLMRCHSRNREVPQGVEHCFMRTNSTPSLRQLQEPGAASALAACLASSRGRGHAEAWNDSGRVCERKLESRWKFASRPQCLCVYP